MKQREFKWTDQVPNWKRSLIVLCGFLLIFCSQETTAVHDISEICEEMDDINLEYCPLRPGIESEFSDLHLHAFHVCEEDFLPPCSEVIFIEEKPQALVIPRQNATQLISSTTITTTIESTTLSTTSPSTTTTMLTTSTEKETCSSCELFCDEERSRCDLSEFVQTSKTMFDGLLEIHEPTATTATQITTTPPQPKSTTIAGFKTEETTIIWPWPPPPMPPVRHYSFEDTLQHIPDTKNLEDEHNYPKVYFDVFHHYEMPSENELEPIPDQFRYLPENYGPSARSLELQQRRLRHAKWRAPYSKKFLKPTRPDS